MNILSISFKNLGRRKLASFLSVNLVAFGISIISATIIVSNQLSNNLEKNARDIDAVIGAKGSPLQLILSSIYYIDFPTGNIPLKEAELLVQNKAVKKAVPLALGDNYKGNRIVGTDVSFADLYQLKLDKGSFWKDDFEVCIGSAVAKANNLKIGDIIHGAHGLTDGGDVHDHEHYKITGILSPQGNVTDHLVLTNISSIWKMHNLEDSEKEITSLLIQYRSPISAVTFPKMVNRNTNLQAASPAMESARLFSLMGIGYDAIKWFTVLIMGISAVSVFVNLYNSLKDREYDLAVMRVMGASKTKLFLLLITEGLILTLLGSILGLLVGHAFVELLGKYQEAGQLTFNGFVFLKQEIYLLLLGVGIGVFAAIIPALQAYNSDISKILSKKE
jgi:putative ABC transport system permease protein